MVIKPDSVITATDNTTLETANSLRTRALATIRLRPATTRPASRPTRAVLVWLRIIIAIVVDDDKQGDTPAQQAAEPEHDHQPGRHRRVVRDLSGGDRPDGAGEPALREGTPRGYQEPEDHRAEYHRICLQVPAEEQ